MGLALAVFGWEVIGAAITFRRVGGARGSPLAPLISLAFAAILAGGWTGPFHVWRAAVAVTGLVGALVLFEWARQTVRGRYFSYIFSADTPTFLCTAGPYAHIRNPFYTSYLVTMVSTALMQPTLFRGLVVAAMTVYFFAAATHEERKFAGSVMAKEYEAYKQRTGRFVPKLGVLIAEWR